MSSTVLPFARKLCVNCAHHDLTIIISGFRVEEHHCNYPAATDPVTGEKLECNVARTNERLCGLDAFWFKPA